MRNAASALVFAGLLTGCVTALPQNDPNPPAIAWQILDQQAQVSADFPATGESFAVHGHTFLVTLHADHPLGVHKISLEGSGRFQCATLPDIDSVSFLAREPLQVSIPRQEHTFKAKSNHQIELLTVSFDYSKLSCGFHDYEGTIGSLEYFATSGTMVFSGAAENHSAKASSGSLSANP
ncbi:MAG TPA: hypothetical protein VHR45_06555 [Thermoanaerobaculia bacterium]|nr:hypothetical protein [Thermoanaerobaculia bacterium]